MARKPALYESKSVYVRLPTTLLDKCRQIAKKEYWNLSDVVREAVKYYLENYEEEK